MAALQSCNITLRKRQGGSNNEDLEAADDSWVPSSSAPRPTDGEPEAIMVPTPLLLQGPAAVAWHLITQAGCTEEQSDAVSLLALSLQRRFDTRPDKTTHFLPVATATNNHRAVWLGGGGVGKTRTLLLVVQPLALSFFGPAGYGASAQANHAAQNLGPYGRTIHSSNALLMTSSLQTARLRLDPQAQKKMAKLVGPMGVSVIDELGCVAGALLHADCLRKTYGKSLQHRIKPTDYMRPQETWGRMPAKLLCGDFLQLPPVPASASLLAPTKGQTYEHQQGRKILADMEYVIDFVQMQRFEDPLQIQVLEAMRCPGGKKISDECWEAIVATKIRNADDAPTASTASSSSGSRSQPSPVWDKRLREARGWWESAYEWRIVSYAMHARARLDAHDAGKILFYIPAVDRPSTRLSQEHYEDMRAYPNISQSAKFPSVLPVFIGMEMILSESVLPPTYVRGTACIVKGIELHPNEPPIEGRDSITTHGCVVLHYMPKFVYVHIKGSKDSFLQAATGEVGVNVDADLTGVLAIGPKSRPWKFKPRGFKTDVCVTRTQVCLMPQKQCTLHGVQGKTADPGFIVHWTFPTALTPESRWLAHYVSLSRPRSFTRLLSHGLPDREIIEGGPPKDILKAYNELFKAKTASTNNACVAARPELGWHARN